MREIDKIALIELKNGKVLVSRSKGKSVFYIPGGKRDEGETDEEALIRETVEELNVEIIPSTIKYIETFRAQADGKADGVLVRMTCYSADYNGKLMASSEIEEIQWFNYKEIARVSAVDKKIFDYLRNKKEID